MEKAPKPEVRPGDEIITLPDGTTVKTEAHARARVADFQARMQGDPNITGRDIQMDEALRDNEAFDAAKQEEAFAEQRVRFELKRIAEKLAEKPQENPEERAI